jgi:hypothetical protein
LKDAEFARAFEAGTVPPAEFDHLSHLRVGWLYLREEPGFDAALARMRVGILRFAAAAGKPEKYHETLTILWMRLLADVRARPGQEREFSDVLVDYPSLADKDLPLRYYSRERLFSDEARRVWVPPETGTF